MMLKETVNEPQEQAAGVPHFSQPGRLADHATGRPGHEADVTALHLMIQNAPVIIDADENENRRLVAEIRREMRRCSTTHKP